MATSDVATLLRQDQVFNMSSKYWNYSN